MFKDIVKKIAGYTGYKFIKKIDHELENTSSTFSSSSFPNEGLNNLMFIFSFIFL